MSNIRGLKELNAKLKKLQGKEANKIVRKGTAKASQVIKKEIKKNTPRKTGTLKKLIKYKIKRLNAGGFESKIGAYGKGFYAMFIEFGTKPHRISRKDGKSLNINGQVVRSVTHPGTRAQPFIAKSFKSVKARAVKEAGVKMMQEINKIK